MIPMAFALGGPWDIAILGGVVLLLFGGSKIGTFGKSLGEGIKEFKKATHEDDPATLPPPVPPVAISAPPAASTTVFTSEKPEEK